MNKVSVTGTVCQIKKDNKIHTEDLENEIKTMLENEPDDETSRRRRIVAKINNKYGCFKFYVNRNLV